MDTKSPIPETATIISPNQTIVSSTDSKSEIQGSDDGVKKSTPRLTWTNETEALLQGWADISSCFKWMHENSFRKYSKVNNYFAIPIIILSTVSGTLNVSLQGYVPAQYLNVAQAGIGGLGIFTGILTTLQNLFKYAQLSESHNNVSIGWSKLNRNIQIELSVERSSRKDADSFIKICRSEYDRLIEQSPTIPLDIIDAFKKMFKEQNEKKKQEKLLKLRERENIKKQISKGKSNQDIIKVLDEIDDDELMLPDICDSINHTKVYKHVINNKVFIETTQGDKVDLTTKSNEVEDEIKNTFRDKINELEKKTSGVAQFKLAMIGERLAPLHHQNNILSHHKDLDNFKDKLDLNKNKFTKIAQSDNFKNIINSSDRIRQFERRDGENKQRHSFTNSLTRGLNETRSSSLSLNGQHDINEYSSVLNRESLGTTSLQHPVTNAKQEIEKLSLKGIVKNISNMFGYTGKSSDGLRPSERSDWRDTGAPYPATVEQRGESSRNNSLLHEGPRSLVENELTKIVIVSNELQPSDIRDVEISSTGSRTSFSAESRILELNDGSTPKLSPRSLVSSGSPDQVSDQLGIFDVVLSTNKVSPSEEMGGNQVQINENISSDGLRDDSGSRTDIEMDEKYN